MTPVFPEGLVETVAEEMFRARGWLIAWAALSDGEREVWRIRARDILSVIGPCVAGLIADRLDEEATATFVDAEKPLSAAAALRRSARIVRSEFVDGEA